MTFETRLIWRGQMSKAPAPGIRHSRLLLDSGKQVAIVGPILGADRGKICGRPAGGPAFDTKINLTGVPVLVFAALRGDFGESQNQTDTTYRFLV